MTRKYYLPANTEKIFTGRQNNCNCSNLSLLLDRYFGYEDNKEKQKSEKGDFFKSIQNPFDQKLIEANCQRWQRRIKSYQDYQDFTASPEWRMIVGLGQTSILETSITLDRVTGIPIIPGSALKGLAASYALLCILEKTNRIDEVEKEYQKYLKKEINELPENYLEFIRIFGYEGKAGQVIFLDAVPTKVPKLEPDIMNNHYPDYYGDKNGKTAPTPYQNPNSVYFLTLGKGSEFAFAVASRTLDKDSRNLVDLACKWLKEGLSELGIGAKTAAGYGYLV
jgi:CRISPR-associated protein Cmr6